MNSKTYDKRTLQQNKSLHKYCAICGAMFFRNKKYSKTQWGKALFCSRTCNGANKKGVTHTAETREKLRKAHKGTSKPWAGRYKRSDLHKERVSKSLKEIYASEMGEVIRERISLSTKGRKQSPEAILKMKESWVKREKYCGGVATLKARKSFYQQLREDRKRNNGGSHSFSQWQDLKRNFGFTCPSCRRTEPEIFLTRDHIVPLSVGGTNDIENIQPLCKSCNSSKHDKFIRYEKQNFTAK